MTPLRVLVCGVLFGCLGGGPVGAQTADAADAGIVTWRYSLKSSALVSRLTDAPLLFPDRGSVTGLWRFRLEPSVRVGDHDSFEIAVEQRLRAFSSSASAAGADVLPTDAPAPFRISPLDWSVASAAHAAWRGEIDRAAAHVHLPSADVTIGRQAIGWGRGVLFSAIDIFSPFTPLEADREWRRGVDAVRIDTRITDRTSLDVAAAFGDGLDRSAFAARLRGYAGKTDVEIVGGRRARDAFAGLTSSAAIGDVELHGELAAFRTPAVPGSIDFGVSRTIVKAVVGGSYRFAVGSGILAFAEYHYSGFGVDSADRIVSALQDPAFQERYLRGDTQILGRHATMLTASYELSPEVTCAAQWLHNPVDGSGVAVPSATWTLDDRWSVLVSGYVPYGRTPEGLTLGSEFGAVPMAAFVQLRVYR